MSEPDCSCASRTNVSKIRSRRNPQYIASPSGVSRFSAATRWAADRSSPSRGPRARMSIPGTGRWVTSTATTRSRSGRLRRETIATERSPCRSSATTERPRRIADAATSAKKVVFPAPEAPKAQRCPRSQGKERARRAGGGSSGLGARGYGVHRIHAERGRAPTVRRLHSRRERNRESACGWQGRSRASAHCRARARPVARYAGSRVERSGVATRKRRAIHRAPSGARSQYVWTPAHAPSAGCNTTAPAGTSGGGRSPALERDGDTRSTPERSRQSGGGSNGAGAADSRVLARAAPAPYTSDRRELGRIVICGGAPAIRCSKTAPAGSEAVTIARARFW